MKYSLTTRAVWFVERMFGNLNTKLQNLRVKLQLGEIEKQDSKSY